MWEGASPVGAPLECWVRAAFATGHRGLARLCGVCLEEEEGGDPAGQEEEEEACLCGETEPAEIKRRQKEFFISIFYRHNTKKTIICSWSIKKTQRHIKTRTSQIKRHSVTLLLTPGLEAPAGFAGLCGNKSSLGGTGGRDDWGGMDMGDGGRSTCISQTQTSDQNLSKQSLSITQFLWQKEQYFPQLVPNYVFMLNYLPSLVPNCYLVQNYDDCNAHVKSNVKEKGSALGRFQGHKVCVISGLHIFFGIMHTEIFQRHIKDVR